MGRAGIPQLNEYHCDIDLQDSVNLILSKELP